MTRQFHLYLVVVITIALGGCANNGPKEDTGMVIGGVLGGVLGHEVGKGHGRTAATIIGTLAGAAIGSAIGRSMDDTDRLKMGTSLETVRTGVASNWRNPDTLYEYQFTPTRTYETNEGPCREFTLDAEIGGNTEQVYGTACRQADGNWKVIK